MKKNIILLKSQFHKIGGLEKYARHIANAFANREYNVNILTSGKKTDFTCNPLIKFHYFDIGYGPNFMKLDQFDRYCSYWQKKFPSPIVLGMDRNTKQTHIRLGNGTHQTYLARRCLFESPVKKLSFSLNPLHKKILQIEKKAFENPSLKKLITNSQMVKDELLNYYDINEEKIVVSHNGVEWDEMQKDFSSWEEQKQKHQKSLNLNPDYFNFLFVGNGFKRKGLKQLIYGLNLIKSKDFYLFVLGHDKNIVDYIKLVKKLGLSKNIFFFGISKDVRKFYQLSDCLVIPSFYDPFANVTLEALAMGLYIVTSKNNGAKEIINKDNGTIIEDLLNIDSISLSLEEAMKQRKTQESAQKIRNSAKKHNFTQQLDHFIDIIEAK